MSMTRPKRRSKTDTKSGSSREISPLRGHHAPSISLPSPEARVSRAGLASRVAGVLVMREVGSAVEAMVLSNPKESPMMSVIEFCCGATTPSKGSPRFHGATLRS